MIDQRREFHVASINRIRMDCVTLNIHWIIENFSTESSKGRSIARINYSHARLFYISVSVLPFVVAFINPRGLCTACNSMRQRATVSRVPPLQMIIAPLAQFPLSRRNDVRESHSMSLPIDLTDHRSEIEPKCSRDFFTKITLVVVHSNLRCTYLQSSKSSPGMYTI